MGFGRQRPPCEVFVLFGASLVHYPIILTINGIKYDWRFLYDVLSVFM